MSRLISFFVLVAIIVVIGLLFYKVMVGFFVPVFLAAVLVVVFRPLHQWVLIRTRNREKLSAVLTTALIMLSVLLPTGLVVVAAAIQGTELITQEATTRLQLGIVFNELRNSLGLQLNHGEEINACQKSVDEIVTRADEIGSSTANSGDADDKLIGYGEKLILSLQILEQSVSLQRGAEFKEAIATLSDEARTVFNTPGDDVKRSASELANNFAEVRTKILGGPLIAQLKLIANPTKSQIDDFNAQVFEFVRPRLLLATGATGSFLIHLVIGTVILIISVFFFLYDGPGMVKGLMALSPLDDRYEEELLMEFDKISRAIVLATMLAAMTQGVVAGLGYYVAGMPSLVLLVILTTVFAMVPFVGPPIVWIPVCLYLAFYQDRIGAAIGLATWGVFVVGTIDNFVKAYVLHGQSQLHPLLALLSILGGVQALGPVGIVVGPMVVALLQTLLSILRREMLHFEDHALVVASPNAPESSQRPRFRLKRKKRPTAKQVHKPDANPAPAEAIAIPPANAIEKSIGERTGA